MHVQPYVLTSKRSECAGQARPTLVFGPRRPKHYHHVQTARARPKLVIGQFDACTSLPGTATAKRSLAQPPPAKHSECSDLPRKSKVASRRCSGVLRTAIGSLLASVDNMKTVTATAKSGCHCNGENSSGNHRQ